MKKAKIITDGCVSIEYNISQNIKYVPTTLRNSKGQKQLAESLAKTLIRYTNQFIPKRSGALQKDGYELETGANKGGMGPWFRIKYRNTDKLPYVMYQYYGEVWGPNWATFRYAGDQIDINTLKLSPKFEQSGWTSNPNKRFNTHRGFRRRKKKFMLRSGPYAGAYVTINGYTTNKRKVQPKWLEYVRDNQEVWDHPYRIMQAEVEAFYNKKLKDKLNRS